MAETNDNWTAGDAHERYMGRWSRPLARSFVTWLGAAPQARWLEVGCGTSALTSAICDLAAPASVVACDPSESFVKHAKAMLPDRRVSFVVADAEHLPELEGPADFLCPGWCSTLSQTRRGRWRPSAKGHIGTPPLLDTCGTIRKACSSFVISGTKL